MFRVSCVLTIASVIFCAASAFAQTSNWTGVQIGVHGGGTQTNYSANLDNASRLCFTSESDSGLGTASAECTVTGDTVTISASSSVAPLNGRFASAEADAEATIAPPSSTAGPPTFSLDASSDAYGTVFATANTETATAWSAMTASTQYGAAHSIAIGLLNFFDLGSVTDIETNSVSIGGHLSYLKQRPNNIVTGVEIDITALPDNEATIHSSDTVLFIDGETDVNYRRSVTVDTPVIGSARLRLGLAIGDLLPYVTGGIGYAHVDVNVSSSLSGQILRELGTSGSVGSSKKFDDDMFGAVIGGGLSWRISADKVLTAEGLYYNFGHAIDISSATVNSAVSESIELEDIVEGRVKFSMYLN